MQKHNEYGHFNESPALQGSDRESSFKFEFASQKTSGKVLAERDLID
jgi:hypothetical protein